MADKEIRMINKIMKEHVDTEDPVTSFLQLFISHEETNANLGEELVVTAGMHDNVTAALNGVEHKIVFVRPFKTSTIWYTHSHYSARMQARIVKAFISNMRIKLKESGCRVRFLLTLPNVYAHTKLSLE